MDTVLITISLGAGAGGIGLLSTVIAAPAVIAIEGVALLTGLLSITGKYNVKKFTSKAEKHGKIKTIASAKLDTITSHVSKALSDNKVIDEEFRLILEELEKYKVMKDWLLVVLEFNATLTAKVISWRSVTHMFPGFLTPVLTQLFFPKPPTTFLTCFCRGERRKYAGKKSRLNWGSNSQPPSHESDTLTTEPPGRGSNERRSKVKD